MIHLSGPFALLPFSVSFAITFITYSARKFSSVPQFCKSDFQCFDWGVLIHVKWSKTIQFRDRKVCIPFSYIPNSHLCPVKAILHAFSFTRSSSDSAQAFAFLDVASGCISTFTYPTFLSHLRTCLWYIGINPKLYAGHSFRRGGASFAYEAGIPIDMIKLIGDWKSDAVLLYLTVPLKMRLHSNNILTKHILQYTDSI